MSEGDNDTAYKKACGQRLMQARIALGYGTRRAFAEALPRDVSEDRLEKWENGGSHVPQRYLRYMKRRWGISADWILDGDLRNLPSGLAGKLIDLYPDIAV